MFQPNSIIAGRYQVIRLVGQGGMSNLYLSHDRKYANALVVVKEMTAAYSDPKEQQMAVELFHREAKLLASLNHRHIPKVYDYFQFAGKYYLSMEFIDGEDLAQKLEAKKGPLPETQVLEWGEQIATVLFYLHKHEPPIVFRDVKPSNIMICEQGVKLIDFGIARHFDQAKKGDTMRIGSPGYAPPEQYAAQTDPRSDIYALGVTLHHALTGRDPTGTQTPFLVPPARTLNPALSESTAAMLARATQINPDDRYQNMLEMKNDIKHILSNDKQSTRVVGAPPALAAAIGTTTPAQGAPQPSTPSSAAAAVAAAKSFVASVSSAAAPATSSSSGASSPATPALPSASSTPSPQLLASASASGSSTAVVANSLNTAPAKQTAKPSKKIRLGQALLAFLVLLFAGAAFTLSPAQRKSIAVKLSQYAEKLSPPSSAQKTEDTIRRIFQIGDPQSLMALLEGKELEQLSKDKQALYRLNLLAAEIDSNSRPPEIIHLLYPKEIVDTNTESALFSACAQTVAAVNGQGGLERKLIIILPTTYTNDGLDNTLFAISEQPAKGGQQILIIGAASNKIALSAKAQKLSPFILGDMVDSQNYSSLLSSLENKDLPQLFQASLATNDKLLWATTSSPTIEGAKKVEFDNTSAGLNSLLERSASAGTTLVMEASQLTGLTGISSIKGQGKLLLLALGNASLPELPPDLSAQALVLGSPLRYSTSSAAQAKEILNPSGLLSVWQARIFDAIILCLWDSNLGDYLGITLTHTSNGDNKLGQIVKYRWTPSGWAPVLKDDQ